MLTEPEIVERRAEAYAFIAYTVPMSDLAAAAGEGFPRFFDLLEAASIEPAGPAFMRYRCIDMEGSIEFEIGAAVAASDRNADHLHFGTLPAGRFGRLRWTGDYNRLIDANAALIGWARNVGIEWDAEVRAAGECFACRLEIYESGPMDDPDPQTWVTEIAIQIA